MPDIASAAAQTHDTFSHYPDLVWTLRYSDYTMAQDQCTKNPTKVENWHLKFGTVLRDLSFEQSATPTASSFGWGLQLSGAYEFNTNPCEGLRDGFYFSVTGGKGISHYFNDLHIVSPTNDAVYSASGLYIAPLMACYMGYTHEWAQGLLPDGSTNYLWSSTVAFSYIGLENPIASPLLTYHQGEELSLNLLYHLYQCSQGKSINYVDWSNTSKPNQTYPVQPAAWKDMFVGVEAVYGQRENFSGNWGDDGRLMFVFAATK